MKGDLNKWSDILCSWTGRLNIVKMSVLPKLNEIPINGVELMELMECNK
jgi:hypothetical protein